MPRRPKRAIASLSFARDALAGFVIRSFRDRRRIRKGPDDMLLLIASEWSIVEGVLDDPRMRERAARLRSGIMSRTVRTVDDAVLAQAVDSAALPREFAGLRNDLEPLVIFNGFRFDDTPEEQERRRQAYPALWRGAYKFHGYDRFHWRDSGSTACRRKTGNVCQPAGQLHTIDGCPFRCAHCRLPRAIDILMKIEDYVEKLPG